MKLRTIKWATKLFKLSKLRPYEKNPRKISDEAYENLKRSLIEDGYHQRMIATSDGRVIGGHMRLRVLEELGVDEVEVLVPNRKLTEDEFRRINIRDNLSFGEFDLDILAAEFEAADLEEWGMSVDWLSEDKSKEEKPAKKDKEPKVCPKCGYVYGGE